MLVELEIGWLEPKSPGDPAARRFGVPPAILGVLPGYFKPEWPTSSTASKFLTAASEFSSAASKSGVRPADRTRGQEI